jgi:hypothetical protein
VELPTNYRYSSILKRPRPSSKDRVRLEKTGRFLKYSDLHFNLPDWSFYLRAHPEKIRRDLRG